MPPNLASGGIASRSLTVFAIGGSGIRSLEPLLHLCALGLGPRQLRVALIDPDQQNAAVTSTRQLIDLYRQTRRTLVATDAPASGYFRTEVVDAIGTTTLWSPISDDEHHQSATFGARVDRPLMSGPAEKLAHVVDMLFSRQLRAMDLTLGFRGVPSIGTVFMHRLREQSFFEQLLVNAQTDPESLIFAIGSIFGGTGAAGLPVIGRVLVDGVSGIANRNDVRGVPRRRTGAAILLPYFTLPAPSTHSAPDGGIRPETSLFAQNAAAAMATYTGDQAGYGGMYVLGDDEPREQEKNEVGGAAQVNRGHYVELFAALAALDFAARGGESADDQLPVFRVTGALGDNVTWSDLPIDDESRARFIGGIIAAHTFLSIFRPDGERHADLEHALRGTTWSALTGLEGDALRRHAAGFDLLGRFFRSTWEWLSEMRGSVPTLELLRVTAQPPTAVELHHSVARRRSAQQVEASSATGLEVFRHWNIAAAGLRGRGGILEVMRMGSEAYAKQF